MIATCPKFGTRGCGVAVCVAVGEGVRVGGTGVEVDVVEGTGEGIMVGDGVAVQAIRKTGKNRKMTERVIRTSQEYFSSEPCEGCCSSIHLRQLNLRKVSCQ
jgi:hypothetical protein